MVAPEVAPNVSARGADDADMGDEVAQREASAMPNPNSVKLDDGTARQIQRPRKEDHVLTGRASFRSWCAACVQGRGRPERHHGEGRKELEDGSKVPVVPWDYCFGARNRTSEAEVAQRGDCPVLVMHVGVTKSNVAHLIPAKRVDFPSYEKVVKMIVQGSEHFRLPQRCVSATLSLPFCHCSER